MKKLFLAAVIGLLTLNSASAQDAIAPVALTLTTNTTVRVAPVQLTTAQMTAIIQAVQGAGVQADSQISAANLQNISVIRTGPDAFTVQISLRANR